jgi:hypothetical protein
LCGWLGGILAAATDKATTNSKKGSLMRKVSSAMKALNDTSVLVNWIDEQIVSEGMDWDEVPVARQK